MTMPNNADNLHQTSVAMCTFNGSRYLAEQLESILCQTQLPDELIVCDDGSTDETIAQIKDFADRSGFPVSLYQNTERLGPAKNFEKAIGLCKGQIIILSDQDDIWFPVKIEKLCQALKAQPEAYYVFSDAQTIGANSESLHQTLWSAMGLRDSDFSGPNQMKRLLKENLVTGAGLAFRASLCRIALPIPPGWMHDYWIGLVGSTISDGIPIPETLYKYRLHAAQVCGWRKKTFFQTCANSLETHAEDSLQKLLEFQQLTKRTNSMIDINYSAKERIELIKEKEFHLMQRVKSRSSTGLSRIGLVYAEARSGRYNRFSKSYYSIARDLVSS